MKNTNDLEAMLHQLNTPAFLVREGCTTAVNAAAKQRMVEVGMPVSDLIQTGHNEYQQFRSGSLLLSVSLAGICYKCTVTAFDEYQLFTIVEDAESAELQALSLAAEQLCLPLSDLALMFHKADIVPKDRAQINHLLHRLQRMVGNMSDAANLVGREPKLEACDIGQLIYEILEKSDVLLQHSNRKLTYHIPNQPIYAMADTELIRRAILNLLSNASKFSPAGTAVDVTVKTNDKILYLTVSNESDANHPAGNIFHRYSRLPGIEDPKYGLGLGMTLIHAAATAHGGTVLVENTKNAGKRVTMTIQLQSSKHTDVRSPILHPDIYGGRDQILVELSDVLPSHLYNDEY